MAYGFAQPQCKAWQTSVSAGARQGISGYRGARAEPGFCGLGPAHQRLPAWKVSQDWTLPVL